MKVEYKTSKGSRYKKGTFKARNKYSKRHRFSVFEGLSVLDKIDNNWWCDELNKWCSLDELDNGYSYSSSNDNILSVKAAIRHVKKHNEISKGTRLILGCVYSDCDVIITK